MNLEVDTSFQNGIYKIKEKYSMGVWDIKEHYRWNKIEPIRTAEFYNKFINLVSGEFDLFLQEGIIDLKVFYPNGWFSICCYNSQYNNHEMEIRVEGRSKIACEKIKNQLEEVFAYLMKYS